MYQMVQQLIESGISANRLWFVRMDHPLLQNQDLGFWVQLLRGLEQVDAERPLYLFLDELNYAKDWSLWLKTFYDEQWPVRIVGTSSSAAALRDGHSESGIGRWTQQYFTPYSLPEFLELQKHEVSFVAAEDRLADTIASSLGRITASPELVRLRELFMMVGGFPELLLQDFDPSDMESGLLKSQQTLRSEAVQRVTGMDLPRVFQIRSPIILERLLYLLAAQMCGLVNVSNLASALEITRPTAHQYMEYLQLAFLVFFLPTYSNSESSSQKKGRKAYFVDGAVRNAALQRGLRPLRDPVELGAMVENLVGSHLYALSLQTDVRLYHWREKGNEVDFVYDHHDHPLAFEVASGPNHTMAGMRAFLKKYPRFSGRTYMVHGSGSVIECQPDPETGEPGRIRLETLLVAVGSQMRAALSQRLTATA